MESLLKEPSANPQASEMLAGDFEKGGTEDGEVGAETDPL